MTTQSGLLLHRATAWNLPRFGGSSAPAQQTVTQKSEPWTEQKPYLKDIFGQAQKLYRQDGPDYYGSSTVSPMTGGQVDALTAIQSLALAGGTSAANANIANLTDTLNGTYLNAGNPAFSAMADRVAAEVMPRVSAGFNNAGRADSGLAARAAASGLGDALGSLAYQNYGDERSNMIKAAAIAPTADQGVFSALNAGAQAGGAFQSQSQNELNDLVNRWNYEQNLPWNKLGNYSQMVQGNYGGTTQTTQPMYQNTGANILGTGAGILGGLSALGGSSGLFPGLFASLFSLSDRRTKEDVVQIGKADNGLPIYSFRYKGEPRTQIGFMAQDVEKKRPDAVANVAGLKMVDYARAVQ